jgi:hypothetical protein
VFYLSYIPDGQRRMANALQGIRICTIMLVICFTKVIAESISTIHDLIFYQRARLKLLSLISSLRGKGIAHGSYPRCFFNGQSPRKNMECLHYEVLSRTFLKYFVSTVNNTGASYLLNGNIQASKTFIKHFTAGVPPSFKLKSDSTIPVGQQDEVTMTKDSLVNFSQMAVLTCQRAQGDQSKVMRESWVRLSGTYQSKVGLLSTPGMRKVSHGASYCQMHSHQFFFVFFQSVLK